MNRQEIEAERNVITAQIETFSAALDLDEDTLSDEESLAHIHLIGFVNELSYARFLFSNLQKLNDEALASPPLLSLLKDYETLHVRQRTPNRLDFEGEISLQRLWSSLKDLKDQLTTWRARTQEEELVQIVLRNTA